MIGFLTVCGLAVLAAGLAVAEEARQGGAAPANTRESLEKKLATLPGAEGGLIISVMTESVARAFPGYVFYVLRFPQYPVARIAPEPLRANNLFVVRPDGSVDHITDAASLGAFFRSALAPVTATAELANAAKAWLRLVQEFHQDGFLQFLIPDDSVEITPAASGGQQVRGKAIVEPRGGNQGEIVASLTFDQAGRLVSASETADIKRGIRPICQATKLLDPDPIVRRMAEQAILVIGKAAKEYLDEQRATASPELQRAIDRVWQQILAEDR